MFKPPFPMASIHPVFSLSLLLLISSSTTSASPAGVVVREVCNKTTYYAYCVDALYSDPRTPNADHYFLAYISFGLVFANASNTLDYISHLMKTPRDPNLGRSLQACQGWYRRGVTAMLSANSDLDSRTFTELASYAGLAVRGADKCEAALEATRSSHALGMTVRNQDVKRLSYICAIVSRLLP